MVRRGWGLAQTCANPHPTSGAAPDTIVREGRPSGRVAHGVEGRLGALVVAGGHAAFQKKVKPVGGIGLFHLGLLVNAEG